ncbi:MAG: hypothetical protein Q4B73_00765 [Lachnospiraceae bacterium]|nr:hypothetical protein [Lachnospiraceae bacterium]
MAWELLPTNYTDAVWNGLKKYQEITNDDGTVSFQDVTTYTNRDNSFFGAKDANRMNEALNVIMSMVENGTDLYTAFQNYFTEQQTAFTQKADTTAAEFDSYVADLKKEGDAAIDTIKTDYREEITEFEEQQEQLFNTWFALIKSQLSEDVAGNLQNQIDALDTKTDGFNARSTAFAEDGQSIEEVDGNKRIVTEFTSDKQITQYLYEDGTLKSTKTVTFSDDGLSIKEDVK